MDVNEFEQIVALGLGRAVLHLLNHDARSYREIILDACLHNKAYDPQVEGGRATYLLDLARASGDLEFFADAVIRSLGEEAEGWDTRQRFQIARLLAQTGNQFALPSMQSAFHAKRIHDTEVAVEFIELDGISGLLFVVAQIGESLMQNPEQWEDDSLLAIAGEICGRDAVESALKDTAETNKNIRAYLDAVEENRALRASNQRPDPKALTYGELRSLIEANQAGGIARQWAKTASDADMALAARDLLQEADPKRLRLYLLLFRKRKFPLALDHLFRLVDLPDGPLPRHALSVLANLEDEEIRKLAFRLVETRSSLRDHAIDLLVKNFRDGDHSTIEAWCDAEQEPGVLNAFDRSLQDFFAAHPSSEIEGRQLRRFYEKEPCAHCRYSIVKRLLNLDGLPNTLRRECGYDSYADTRELVQEGIN